MTQPAPELPGYRLERVLGSGGYSDVYLYRQHLPDRLVAVKVLRAAGLAAQERTKFTAEANAMAGLADHPNIVSVLSAAVSADGRPYIVMQYYSAPNLAVRAASERLGVPEVLRIGVQIASAVETAHRAGILHRDIKPANLLINQYGTPGLTDFGIAGQMAELDDDEDTGVSVPWAPPEVLYSTSPATVRSDVYSLAATLWHLLTGRSPFELRSGDNSTFALMRRVRDDPPPSLARPDAPDSLDRVLRQAMSKDPARRPASAIEFARHLQAVEQELQLPRTEIAVTTGLHADTGPAPVPPAHYSTAPSTVARPLAVSPQAPLEYRPADGSTSPPTAPPTSVRPNSYAAQPRTDQPWVEQTSVRPKRAGSGGDADDDAPPRSRTPLLIAAVVVLVGGGTTAVLLAGGDSGGGRPAPTTAVSGGGNSNAGLPGEDIPPGPVTITAKRASNGAITFSWTYSAALSTDTFQWRETTGTKRKDVTVKPTLTLPSAGRARTCIQVRVVRADGTNAAATYSPQGCG